MVYTVCIKMKSANPFFLALNRCNRNIATKVLNYTYSFLQRFNYKSSYRDDVKDSFNITRISVHVTTKSFILVHEVSKM